MKSRFCIKKLIFFQLKEIDYYVDRKVFSGCRRKKFPTLTLTPLIFRKGN